MSLDKYIHLFAFFLFLSISNNVFGQTDCTLNMCVDPFFDNQNPTTICPEFCNGEIPDYILDTYSSFNCSVSLSEDSTCFEYLPLPLLPSDELTIVGVFGDEYDTIKIDIQISCVANATDFEEVISMKPGEQISIDPSPYIENVCNKSIFFTDVSSIENVDEILEISTMSNLGFLRIKVKKETTFQGPLAFLAIICSECDACISAIINIEVEEAQPLSLCEASIFCGGSGQVLQAAP